MEATAAATKWVYGFSEGSRAMRDLLGGKGANVAEMTRILGTDRVPAGFALGEEAHAFMTGALGAALADTPGASALALRQAERAISETLEHHAHVRLRSASPL